MTFTFERLDESTHDDVRALVLEGLGEHWGVIDETLNPDLDDMLVAYADGHTTVARDASSTIVGTGTLLPRDDTVVELVRMSVSRTARRSGIGRSIVGELIDIARSMGFERMVLETTSSWSAAIALYTSCGFEITHTEESEFGSLTWFALDLGHRALDDPGSN